MGAGKHLLEKHKDAIAQLCRELGVEKLYAFGSVLNDDFSERSDIDLLVKFDHENYGEEYLALEEALHTLLQKRIDLLTTAQVSNPFFIAALNRTKERIYG